MDLESLIQEPTDDGVIEDLSKTNIREGEKRLMLALLANAIDDFQKYVRANDQKGKELFHEAEEWFLETDSPAFFSFENVCEFLQLNASYLRQGLLRWKEAKRNGQAKQSANSVAKRSA